MCDDMVMTKILMLRRLTTSAVKYRLVITRYRHRLLYECFVKHCVSSEKHMFNIEVHKGDHGIHGLYYLIKYGNF